MNIAPISKIINTNNREEYFENPTKDYFNIEKNKILLIKGKKKGAYIRHVPDHYGPKDSLGYALIRGFNCQAKCTYCYLQSYFKSPDMVKFTNIDDYISFLKKFLLETTSKNPKQKIFLYDGDFYDSLGYSQIKENILEINKIIELIEGFENVYLEIRTKAVLNNIELYNNLKISNKVIYGITFSPQEIINKYEKGTSNLSKRILLGKYISNKGGKIGVRIDPIIIDEININHGIEKYITLVNNINLEIGKNNIFNRAIGVLRIKEKLYKYLFKNNNGLTNNISKIGNFYTYQQDFKNQIYNTIIEKIGSNKIYICMDN